MSRMITNTGEIPLWWTDGFDIIDEWELDEDDEDCEDSNVWREMSYYLKNTSEYEEDDWYNNLDEDEEDDVFMVTGMELYFMASSLFDGDDIVFEEEKTAYPIVGEDTD